MTTTTPQEEEILERGRLADELASSKGFLLFMTEVVGDAVNGIMYSTPEQKEQREQFYHHHAAFLILQDRVRAAREERDRLALELTRRTDGEYPQRPSEFNSEREELSELSPAQA